VADLHVHSDWSDGMATVPAILAHAEANTDLDVIAIADHDQVRGALAAVEWCAGRPAGRLQAVVASEISAAWGRHLVALFFAEPYPTAPFPRYRSLAETIARIHDAGGIAVLPHPGSALVPSVGVRTLDGLLRLRDTHPALAALQAVEVCSGVVGGHRQ
jgi:predicted metal-dependent phosphoesterase TrpH